MLPWLKQEYGYLHSTFHGSETILWARFNVLLGAAWTALMAADLSPFFENPKLLTSWLIFSNLVNEMARRRNAEYDTDGSIK